MISLFNISWAEIRPPVFELALRSPVSGVNNSEGEIVLGVGEWMRREKNNKDIYGAHLNARTGLQLVSKLFRAQVGLFNARSSTSPSSAYLHICTRVARTRRIEPRPSTRRIKIVEHAAWSFTEERKEEVLSNICLSLDGRICGRLSLRLQTTRVL